MRILILNWRCPRHPRAGGAEILTHEVARRLVAAGDQVEWFCGSFPGALPEEDIDGVRVVRAGRQWSVHWRAFRRYRNRLRGRFDLVIDEINTMPFFTPLWADVPILTLIFQLAREVWWYESKFPISAIGFLAERFYLMAYRKIAVVTISHSTKSDLSRLGFRGPITIMPIGIQMAPSRPHRKSPSPSFVYVGRLTPSKRIGHILEAFALFRASSNDAKLWLIGEGSSSYTKALHRLAGRLHLGTSVEFLGRTSLAEKSRRMAESHALLMASVREGWGLVVTEANSYGTPAIVYDVAGLRDAVKHGQTGLVVKASPADMASGMSELLADPAVYNNFVESARRWSLEFSLDQSAETLRSQLLEAAAT